MKQSFPARLETAQSKAEPSSHASQHPLQRRIDASPRQLSQRQKLTQWQPQPPSTVVQAKFMDISGMKYWMQDVDNAKLLERFGGTTASLWSALRDSGSEVYVDPSGSGGSYGFSGASANTLQLSKNWMDMIQDYVDKGTKVDQLARATSALTHEMSHAHDHKIRKESPAGASRDGDDWVVGVLKTELRAWMKEARSARENIKEKRLVSTGDDNNLIFSWIAVNYLIEDKVDLLSVGNNVVINRLKKYYNDNMTQGKSSSLPSLLTGAGLMALLTDYAGQVRNKFTSADDKMRSAAADYMK